MNYIQIGKIVNTHGLKGEVKVLASTDFKHERYHPQKPVYIFQNGQYLKYYILRFREHKGFDLLTIDGLENINLVEKFKGCDLFSEDIPIKHLEEDEYHVNDLLDIPVYQTGMMKGIIKDIREYPQGDYLVIEKIDKTTALVPFRDEFVTLVDTKNRRIEIVDIEGLL